MCGGIEYHGQKIYFPQTDAKIPVLQKNGDIQWIAWGNRDNNTDYFPKGGWARYESIVDGKWDKLHPQPVQILADKFMEKDHAGNSHWFDVKSGSIIQGLIASYNFEKRIYVVTIKPPSQYAYIHNRWPRLIDKTSKTESLPVDNKPIKKTDLSLLEPKPQKNKEKIYPSPPTYQPSANMKSRFESIDLSRKQYSSGPSIAAPIPDEKLIEKLKYKGKSDYFVNEGIAGTREDNIKIRARIGASIKYRKP